MSLSPQKWYTPYAAVLLAALCPRPAGAACDFTTNKVQILNGSTITYRLTITNNTGSGFRGLYLTDTVTPAITNQTSSAPPEFATATIYDTASGTLYTWEYDLGGKGASILGSGDTYTFTITGTVPDECALYGVGNTAFFRVSGSGCSGFAAEGLNTVVSAANLLVTQTMVPPNPVAGGPVSYTILVENTGTVTLTSLVVTDTLATAIIGVVESHPPDFSPQGPTPTGGGDWYGWKDTGSLTFGPGDSRTFTLAGTVAATCVATEVSNTSYAEGLNTGCGASATAVISNVTDFNLPVTPVALDVTQTRIGGGGIGDPVTWRIVVTNIGAATATSLLIVDTLSPTMVVAGTAQPAEMGAPAVASVAGGTRYVWSGMALTLSPTGSFTFTITGNVGVVCAPDMVSNSAYVMAAAICAQGEALAVPDAFAVLPATTGLMLATTQTPPSPGTGQTVTWRIVATNTGTATLTSLVITDTVAATVTGVTSRQPPGWPAATVTAAGAGGTIFAWSGGALPLLPGVPLTFTITGVVGSVCAETLVSATAYVTAAWDCGPGPDASANGTAFTVAAAPAAVTVALLQSAGGPAGSPVTYRIVVTNTGAATIRNLTVTDTVAALVVNQATDQPAAVGVPVVTDAPPGGTRYVWSATAMPVGLEPGRSFTFTVTGKMGVACTPTIVTNTGYVEASAGCAISQVFTGVVAALATPPVASLSVVARQTPAGPSSGQSVTYRIVVANTGTATLTSLTVTDTVSPAVTGAVADQPAGWAAAAVTPAAPGGTLFTWTNNALSFAPNAVLTFTITGTVGTCFPGIVSNTPFVTGGDGCAVAALSGNVTAFPLGAVLTAAAAVQTIVSVGQWFDAVLTVTNTGNDVADQITGAAAVAPALSRAVLVAGPVPPGPVMILPGAAQTFTWTYSATGGGTATLTMTATGLSCGGAPIRGSDRAGMTIQTPAVLSASVRAFPSPRDTGQTFLVVMTVTNTGQAAATGVAAAAFNAGGGGTATLADGPSAPFPIVLAGGARAIFTWTFTGVGPGNVWLTTTVTGTDANSMLTVSTGPVVSSTELIQTPAALDSAVSISRAVVSTGQWVTVWLTVTNTGGATVTSLAPRLLNSSTAFLNLVQGPVPPGPISLPGGSATTFAWTWSPVGGGAISFTLSAGGFDANNLARLSVTQTVTGLVEPAAVLSSVLVFLPPAVSSGASVLATVTVTNTGEAAILGVFPPSLSFSGYGGLTLAASPPVVSVNLNGGQSVTWTWTLTAGSEGAAFATGPLSGTDANSGRIVSGVVTSATPLEIGTARYVVVAFDASPGEVELDRVVTLVMTVSNTGRFVLANARPGPLAVTGDGVVIQLTGPQPALVANLGLGGSASFTWTFRSIRGGLVYFADGAVATGATAPSVTANPVRIVEAGGSLKDAIVYPTPFDPDTALMGGLRFRHMPPFTEVRVYTNAGDVVRKIVADDDGLAIWNARNDSGSRVAPGIYFWTMKSPKGGIRRGKFEVAR